MKIPNGDSNHVLNVTHHDYAVNGLALERDGGRGGIWPLVSGLEADF